MTLILEDNVLANLARNAALTSVFPFLGAATSAGCNCAGRQPRPDFNAIRLAVSYLSQDGRDRFKQLTGATQVRVYYRDGAGATQTLTF